MERDSPPAARHILSKPRYAPAIHNIYNQIAAALSTNDQAAPSSRISPAALRWITSNPERYPTVQETGDGGSSYGDSEELSAVRPSLRRFRVNACKHADLLCHRIAMTSQPALDDASTEGTEWEKELRRVGMETHPGGWDGRDSIVKHGLDGRCHRCRWMSCASLSGRHTIRIH
ncbi:hypothetical protein K0M31_013065 [Melipona bicolor]|uniref:Uncharacterized protein n=1 Tax=Melipona bicolor TaxID=60889 RepID=A0AA40KGJ7_9HYME|nr:hypothetical protein K0M31_013065 [Melipona bicolor]